MHSVDWIKLLRQVPAEQVDNISLITVLGVEIAVQTIVQLEEQFAVIRGRMSGTNDDGKSFIVPYDQLCFLGFQRPVADAKLLRMLNGTADSFATPAPAAESGPVEEAKPEAVEAPLPNAAELPPTAHPRNATPTKSPNMTALLERIRARSQHPNGERAAPAQ